MSQNDENIILFSNHNVKVVHYEIGLVWNDFLGKVPVQSSLCEAGGAAVSNPRCSETLGTSCTVLITVGKL